MLTISRKPLNCKESKQFYEGEWISPFAQETIMWPNQQTAFSMFVFYIVVCFSLTIKLTLLVEIFICCVTLSFAETATLLLICSTSFWCFSSQWYQNFVSLFVNDMCESWKQLFFLLQESLLFPNIFYAFKIQIYYFCYFSDLFYKKAKTKGSGGTNTSFFAQGSGNKIFRLSSYWWNEFSIHQICLTTMSFSNR